jgi:hypothetical protein
MKKVLLVALAISLLAAGTAFAGVAGSMHDLGTGSIVTPNVAGTGSGQVCVFCHHPHRGQVNFAGTPLANAILWNITDWNPSVYPVYDSDESSTFNATTGGDLLNDGSARAYASFFCMACHDGLIAADALVRPPRDGTNTLLYTLPDASDLGATLEDDHPVNFTVNSALVTLDGELDTLQGNGEWSSTELTSTYPLFDLRMQCSTCHDVHRGTIGLASDCAANSAALTVTSSKHFKCEPQKRGIETMPLFFYPKTI